MSAENIPTSETSGIDNTTVETDSSAPGIHFESEEQFDEWRSGTGFTNGFHGTFEHESGRGYLYAKPAHHVETFEQADESLALLRDLTQKGVLYPGTVWGSYKDDRDQFQLFALTPTLTQDLEGAAHPKSFAGPGYAGLFEEGSHVLEWMKRADPGFDPNEFSETSPALLLNPWEAAHRDNWAWDDTGTLYPIDVEVVNVSGPNRSAIVHAWSESRAEVTH